MVATLFFGLDFVSECVEVTKMEAGLADSSMKHVALTPFSYSLFDKPELRPRIDSSFGSGCESGCDCEVNTCSISQIHQFALLLLKLIPYLLLQEFLSVGHGLSRDPYMVMEDASIGNM